MKVTIMEACRDSGGPLRCRECGRPVSRSESEIHYIEDGMCDCKKCYDRAMKKEELDDEVVSVPKPKLVVLCGSSRFCQEMAVCAWFLERDEKMLTMGLHLLPWWYDTEEIPDHLAEHEGVADAMDELHLRKLDMAKLAGGEVFVVNCDHYIGDSTRREIAYAESIGLPIRWYTDDPLGKRVAEFKLAALKKWVEKEKTEETKPNVEMS